MRVGKKPSEAPSIFVNKSMEPAAITPAKNEALEPRLHLIPRKRGGNIKGSHKFIEAKTFSNMPSKYMAEISPAKLIKTIVALAIIKSCFCEKGNLLRGCSTSLVKLTPMRLRNESTVDITVANKPTMIKPFMPNGIVF